MARVQLIQFVAVGVMGAWLGCNAILGNEPGTLGGEGGSGGAASTSAAGSDGGSSSVGSSSSGSASATSGAGGGISGPEDCLDGFDNDKNGLVDCEDPACSPGFECVPAPPPGWTFTRIQKATYQQEPVENCADQSPPAVYFVSPDDGSCTGCSCAPNVSQCNPPELTCYIGNTAQTCSSGTPFTIKPTDELCKAVPLFPAGAEKVGCLLSASSKPPNNAACDVTNSTLMNADPFGGEILACDAPKTGGGCAANSVCAPKASGAYEGECVVKSGSDSVPCPNAFSVQYAVYQSGVDSRSCTACDCSGVSLACAGMGTITIFDLNNCTVGGGDPPVMFNALNQCKDVTTLLDLNTASIMASNTPKVMANGSCSGGAPTGSVMTEGPTTICCQ